MTEDMIGEEIINFPVPRKYLGVVIQAIASAMSDTPPLAAPAPQPVPWPVSENQGERYSIEWNEERLRRLSDALRAEGARTMLDLTAERPGQFISLSDIVERSGRNRREAAADLGTLTKLIKKQFGIKHNNFNWPTTWMWAAGGEQQAYYTMEPEIAQAWKAVSQSRS